MIFKEFYKKILVSLVLLANVAFLAANEVDYIHPFKLNPVNDSIILGAGTLLTGSALFCDKVLKIKDNNYNPEEWLKSDVPVFDQIFMQPYNNGISLVSYGTLAISLLSPAIFVTVPNNEWLGIGMMYAETMLCAYGVKEWAKLLIYRCRPYMYFDKYPEDKLADGDWNCSMPSGHTTGAFAGAAFVSYLFNQYYPDSKWRYAVTGVSFGLAAATGALRMWSGNHYFSDVLAGAVIGTIFGFAVPYMHTDFYYSKFKKKGTSVALTPMGFNLQIKF